MGRSEAHATGLWAQMRAEQAQERAQVNEEARRRAEDRIASALHSNKEILVKRQEDFDNKQAENEKRRRQVIDSVRLIYLR